jgi:hypothetical protein
MLNGTIASDGISGRSTVHYRWRKPEAAVSVNAIVPVKQPAWKSRFPRRAIAER